MFGITCHRCLNSICYLLPSLRPPSRFFIGSFLWVWWMGGKISSRGKAIAVNRITWEVWAERETILCRWRNCPGKVSERGTRLPATLLRWGATCHQWSTPISQIPISTAKIYIFKRWQEEEIQECNLLYIKQILTNFPWRFKQEQNSSWSPESCRSDKI